MRKGLRFRQFIRRLEFGQRVLLDGETVSINLPPIDSKFWGNRFVGKLFQSITDVTTDWQVVCNRRYGVIEVVDQQLKAIHFRPYPKLVSVSEIRWAELWKERFQSKRPHSNSSNSTQPGSDDRVLLYFNQPIMHTKFLALKYFVSDYRATLASIAVCLSVLDWVAKTKKTDAIVSEISNKRIKDRHLQHFGWEQHLPNSRKRHWIKRFYGVYPDTFLFQSMYEEPLVATADFTLADAPAFAATIPFSRADANHSSTTVS